MDIPTTVGVAQQSVKAALEILRVTADAVVDSRVKAKLIEVQHSVLDVQSKLGDAYSERLTLQATIAELRESLRLAEARRDSLDSYALVEVEAGKLLRRSKPEAGHDVEHFACPSCHSAGKVAVMQTTQTGAAQYRYSCSVCPFTIFAGPPDPPRRTAISTPFRARSW